MTFKLRSIAAATTAALIMGFGFNAMADSTTDIVNALVTKGVLTEEEGALLTKGHTDEAAGQAKAMKKASKLSVSDAIDKATVYGDIRVRYEDRSNTVQSTTATNGTDNSLGRSRYKVTFGIKTDTADSNWYSDLAFAMGSKGRSDNADFGTNTGSSAQGDVNGKQALYVKRAMVGFKATDWLTIEAGRMTNPLYTTPMVWDADLTVEGLSEQAKFKAGDAEISLVALQDIYTAIRKVNNGVPQVQSSSSIATGDAELLAFQAAAKYAFNDVTSAKAGITYTTYTKNAYATNFGAGNTATSAFSANDLNTIEIPAEVNYMAASNVGVRLFGDYVVNTSADDRAKHSAIAAAANGSSNSDGSAWMLGAHVGSAKDLKGFESNKMVKGDWSARLWYQDVGAWALDAALVDSDIFDSRVNIKGTTFKAQYNIEDAVALNFAYAHGKKKNSAYYAFGSGDMGGDLAKIDLVQVDLTYKF